jgi:large subunit ribosomal protein L25
MSTENFELIAEVRTDMGKGASRRLRHTNKIPAIMYGGGKDPLPMTLVHHELLKHLEHEAFYSHILTIKVDGKSEKVVLRDLQRHPSKPYVMHADFLRVSETEKLRMHVPLHFINEDIAVGVKQEGGVISHNFNDVEVSCLAKNLPEFIEVDLAELKLGESLHLSQIKLPAGVELVELSHGESHDHAVAGIHKSRGSSVVEDEAVEGEEGSEGSEGSEG